MQHRGLSFYKTESKEKAEARGSKSMRDAANHIFVKGCPGAEDSSEFLSTWTEEQEAKTGDTCEREARIR